MAKKTLKQRHQEFLEARGWAVDLKTKVSKYLVMSKPGANYHYYLGGAGAVRRGRTVAESISIKLKIEPQKAHQTVQDAPRTAISPEPAPDAPKRICSWCEKAGRPAVMAEGTEPASHGICSSCKAQQMAEMEATANRLEKNLGDLADEAHRGKVTPEEHDRQHAAIIAEEDKKRSDPTAASASPHRFSAGSAVAMAAAPAGKSSTSTLNGKPPSPLAILLRKAVDASKAVAEPTPAPRERPTFDRAPTPEQEAILDAAVKLGKGDVLVIEAGAGTGKTTTLTMLEQVLGGRGQYTAFNSSLVAESKAKFKKCKCNTTHSLAFRAEGKRFAGRLSGQRVRSDEIARMMGLEDFELVLGVECSACGNRRAPRCSSADGKHAELIPHKRNLAAGFLAAQVMQAIRRFCQSADREIGAGHFKYLDGLDLPTPEGKRTYSNNEQVREYLAPFAAKAWADLSDPEGKLPFSHDVYVKVWQLGKPVISADYLLVDESQDSAPVFLDICKQQKGLTILVGDSAQAIYEWRGAVNAMDAYPDAKRLYLSQSFRFGPAIAAVANQILEKVGTPLRLKGLASIPSKVEPCADPTAILCRTNAAAVGKVLAAIAEGKRPFLVGGGSDVVSFVKGAQQLQQSRSTSHPELACFGSWSEVQEYVKADAEGEDLKLWVKLIDSYGTEAILGALERMPAEKDSDLVVCTAHKSKGREWDRVKLAADFPTLSKCCDADFKLLYVACTRAKLVLDISECPFFTGEDAMEIIPPPRNEAGEVLPPTPAAPPARKPAEDFSWSKAKEGGWCIRGPQGHEGKSVKVVRRDGSSSTVRLGKIIREFDEAVLYEKL